jgi:hypothetical protein
MSGKGKEMVPGPGEADRHDKELGGVNFELMKLAVNEDKWW